MKKDICGFTLPELEAAFSEYGFKKFRAKQVYTWLHQKRAVSFDEMTDLSKEMRERLSDEFEICSLSIAAKYESALDETKKYLLKLPDGNCIEAVWMEYHHGISVCISTQVGCRMGCKFCASTLGGLVRSLEPSEMLGEIYALEKDNGRRIDSVVLMGIGEPLDNFDNVIKFLTLLSAKEGPQLSLRHVSLSTCGIVPQIKRLAELKLGLTLSVSLHASNNYTRSQIMPINQKYDIHELMEACREYFQITGRRISFEYALIDGKNDTPAYANELARLLKSQHMPCHVNLIPVNEVKERDNKRSSREAVNKFRDILNSQGINATVRRELGADINAACGQLRRETLRSEVE